MAKNPPIAEPVQLNLRLPGDVPDRADRLAKATLPTGGTLEVTRAYILREALLRGLALLEAERLPKRGAA